MMSSATTDALANKLSLIPPGILVRVLDESPADELEVVERLLRRCQMVQEVRALSNPLRGLWAGAEERRHEHLIGKDE